MIQEISPNILDISFKKNIKTCSEDYIFLYKGENLLLKKTGDQLTMPRRKDLPECRESNYYLFSLNKISCYLLIDDTFNINYSGDNFLFYKNKFSHSLKPKVLDFLSGVSVHIKHWLENNRFCGKCGTEMELSHSERNLVCSKCKHCVYPSISPAIIVAVLHRDKLLMARGAHFPEGFYSLVAGYADFGETLEDAVKREVQEEVGLKVKNIRYYKSQPWPFSGSMIVGFIAELDGDDKIIIDDEEIVEANWYYKDNLPQHPGNRSVGGEMIEKFISGDLKN